MLGSIGQSLKAQRLARGLELAQVVADLRIKLETLEALEDDRLIDIGHQSYALGFLRSYGKYLGLDSDALVEEAKLLVVPAVKVEEDFIHLDEPTEVSLGVVVSMSMAAIVVVVLVWMSSFAPSEQAGEPIATQEETTAALTQTAPLEKTAADQLALSGSEDGLVDAAKSEPSPEPPNKDEVVVVDLSPLDGETTVMVDNETQANPEADAPAKVSISLHVARETWMRISNSDDKVLFSSIVDLGTVYELNDNEIYYIASRDAGAIEIMRNGVVVDTLGKDSEILARRTLDVSRYVNRP